MSLYFLLLPLLSSILFLLTSPLCLQIPDAGDLSKKQWNNSDWWSAGNSVYEDRKVKCLWDIIQYHSEMKCTVYSAYVDIMEGIPVD